MPREDQHLSVRVSAPARLHLGFLDLNGNLGRRFGSIGLAIDEPVTTLVVERSTRDAATGAEAQRALRALSRLKTALHISSNYRVRVEHAIPAHSGLGSGTQLSLAIGAALSALEELDLSSTQIGQMLNRGARSAIGMAAFERGGFVIDGGKRDASAPPPVVVQTAFPSAWRILLVFDRARLGVHGAQEATAFDNLNPMPETDTGRLCRLTMMQLLPALADCDLASFGSAISEIQTLVGRQFAAAQGGGMWASPAVERLVGKLAEHGAVGIGQSSWGPTGFAFVDSQAAADRLYQLLYQEAIAEGLEISAVKSRNVGAKTERPVAAAEFEPERET